MKTNIFATYILTCLLLFTQYAYGQSTSANNNPLAGKFLGFNDAQNIEFRTNNTTRMRLQQTGNALINGYKIDNSGFLSLSMVPAAFNQQQPYSLLHISLR